MPIISGLVRSTSSEKSARLLTKLWQLKVRILSGDLDFVLVSACGLGEDEVMGEPKLLFVKSFDFGRYIIVIVRCRGCM